MELARLTNGSRVTYQLRGDSGFIANFDSLEAAAIVLRYVNGGNMDDNERDIALTALSDREMGN